MTDDNHTSESFDEQVLNEQLTAAREQITSLQGQLAVAQEAARSSRRMLVNAQAQLQTGLMEVLTEEDEDRAEWLKDFLEANTPWEFSLTRQFRVTLNVQVLVEAKNEEEADQMANDWNVEVSGDGDPEVDGVSVEAVDEAD